MTKTDIKVKADETAIENATPSKTIRLMTDPLEVWTYLIKREYQHKVENFPTQYNGEVNLIIKRLSKENEEIPQEITDNHFKIFTEVSKWRKHKLSTFAMRNYTYLRDAIGTNAITQRKDLTEKLLGYFEESTDKVTSDYRSWLQSLDKRSQLEVPKYETRKEAKAVFTNAELYKTQLARFYGLEKI